MSEKQFKYNVNKNAIEYNNHHFAYLNGEEFKITKKLNTLAEENENLKLQINGNEKFVREMQSLMEALLKTKKRLKEENIKQNEKIRLLEIDCEKKLVENIGDCWSELNIVQNELDMAIEQGFSPSTAYINYIKEKSEKF